MVDIQFLVIPSGEGLQLNLSVKEANNTATSF